MRAARPGVVLLFGGADGDDPAGLLHNAGRLARARVRYPVRAGRQRGGPGGRGGAAAGDRTLRGRLRQRACPAAARCARAGAGGAGRSCTCATCSAGAARRWRRGSAGWCGHHAGRGRARDDRAGPHLRRPGPRRRRRLGHHRRAFGRPAGPARRTVEGDLGVRAAAGGVLVEGQAEGWSTRWRPICSGRRCRGWPPRSATCPGTRAARPRTGGSPRWPPCRGASAPACASRGRPGARARRADRRVFRR